MPNKIVTREAVKIWVVHFQFKDIDRKQTVNNRILGRLLAKMGYKLDRNTATSIARARIGWRTHITLTRSPLGPGSIQLTRLPNWGLIRSSKPQGVL